VCEPTNLRGTSHTHTHAQVRELTNLRGTLSGEELEEGGRGGDLGEPVVVTITLHMDLNKVGDVETFKRDVASDVSLALGPDARSVKVQRVRAGSIIVDLEITPQVRGSGRDLHQALVEQAADPRSALMSGKYTKYSSKTISISPPGADAGDRRGGGGGGAGGGGGGGGMRNTLETRIAAGGGLGGGGAGEGDTAGPRSGGFVSPMSTPRPLLTQYVKALEASRQGIKNTLRTH
jgi:hypothetical protein